MVCLFDTVAINNTKNQIIEKIKIEVYGIYP
jgi:hypothetical protein